jgi:DNA-3-methyladenine glycosylase II
MDRATEAALAAADSVMAGLVAAAGPCTLRPAARQQPYESLLSAIAHQQLNGTAAATILRRFQALYPATQRLPRSRYPQPAALMATSEETLRSVGLSRAKVLAVKDIAAKTLEGIVPPRRELVRLDDEAVIRRLVAVRGVGRWTVEMFLMFTLGRPDVLPVDDYGVQNGFRLAYGQHQLPKPKALAAYGERWAPYRTTAAWYLWRAVDLHKAGQLPAPPAGAVGASRRAR